MCFGVVTLQNLEGTTLAYIDSFDAWLRRGGASKSSPAGKGDTIDFWTVSPTSPM